MQRPGQRVRLEHVAHLVMVASGKGGVGKSTVSVNLAVALAQRGARVGLLDADAYGPSVPMMLGVRKPQAGAGWGATLPLGQRGGPTLAPLERFGVRIMSVGFFIGEEQAVAPMPDVLGLMVRQLLHSVAWGELDYLLLDLPPGTAEPQSTLCRELRFDGVLLVTTPQDIARIDTAKALAMFQANQVPVLGVVENMSGFICPHCGQRSDIFPPSERPRTQLDDVPVLVSVPLDPVAGRSGDQGQPIVVGVPHSPVALAFTALAARFAALLGD
ncbi:MAG TPA: P-loop NTPase [Ktedonobacterales bacterium]|jgi:ATP-binding protein involved in chromosome partitioning|nr:P-loop NTPase [Ktedonobacterales bacterium]